MATILIVDDSTVMRKKIRAMLTQAGHTVVGEADTGQHAIHEYAKLQPEIVTMDITMPNMDGIEAVRKIIESSPNAQIIMLSGEGQKGMVLEAIKNGAKNYIIKPIDERKFLQVIRTVDAEAKMVAKKNLQVPKSRNVAPIPKQENKIEPANTLAFTIENINGFFIIHMNKNVDQNTYNFLNVAIQGLLFIRPLKVIVDFSDMDVLNEEILKGLFNTISVITKSEGTLRVISQNEKFIQFASRKYFNIEVEIYSDIKQFVV